ncbi:MAG TPA: MFS transporter [Rubrobacteraceae bacterium]|nr:MFS transporter [Rubrobacteraceae bacterium]
MNFRILVLTSGTFAIGTGTFVVTGILGEMARDLAVSVGSAGYLITVFAVVYALGSPVLVAATGGVERRHLLIAALCLFAFANGAAALAPSFFWLLGARGLAACGAAVLTPVAAAVASELAAPGHEGRSLSLVMGGLSVAWVFGIPLGTVVGDYYGWRASFVLVAILSAIAALGVRALLPPVEVPTQGNLRSRLAAGRLPAVLVALLVTALGVAAGFVVLTYVRPLLEGLTGFESSGIGVLLLLFGLAAVAGTAFGGVAADRWGYGTSMFAMLLILPLSLVCFSLLFGARAGSFAAIAGAGAALAAWSVAGFAIIPLQQYRLVKVAPDDQDAVLSLNASAIYLGQGAGSGLGSLVLAHGSLPYLGGAGALCAAAALTVLTLGGWLQHSSAASSKKQN